MSTSRFPVATKLLEIFKYAYSLCLLVFVVVIVHASIFTEQTVGVKDNGVPPVAAFFIIWFLIVWLAVMEGGQGDLVGLQYVDDKYYKESHPITWRNTQLAHKGDNLARFIIGRQFLAFLVIFVTNLMGSATPGATVLGFPRWMNEIFLENGVAMILFVIVLGQLTSQVNAANCMLDFINNRFMLFGVVYVALAIEASGLLHFVYLIKICFSRVTNTKTTPSTEVIEEGTKKENDSASNNKDAPTVVDNLKSKNMLRSILFWGRVFFSVAVLAFSLAVILESLFRKQTAMWEGVPPYVSVILFVLLMVLVGMLEGAQIAIFAILKMPEEVLASYRTARVNCDLVFKNLEAFLIGRQICATLCMFVVARIVAITVDVNDGNNIFGVPNGLQEFFNLGILGAIVTTLLASLVWRIIATSSPLLFMSIPLHYVIIRLCLLLEATGVCSASKLVAALLKKIMGYQLDEDYIDDFDDLATLGYIEEVFGEEEMDEMEDIEYQENSISSRFSSRSAKSEPAFRRKQQTQDPDISGSSKTSKLSMRSEPGMGEMSLNNSSRYHSMRLSQRGSNRNTSIQKSISFYDIDTGS